MKRGILIGLLVGGIVAGLSLGFCRMGHARWKDHDKFHDRVAETCSEATLRVLERERGSRHHDFDRGRPPHDRAPHDAPPPPPAAPPAPPPPAP